VGTIYLLKTLFFGVHHELCNSAKKNTECFMLSTAIIKPGVSVSNSIEHDFFPEEIVTSYSMGQSRKQLLHSEIEKSILKSAVV
jgi:hypothetical protein